MKNIILIFSLLIVSIACNAQSAYYGAIYINTIDSAFLGKVINMEKQKDSEITNIIYYSHNEKIQLNALDNFLKNPFTQKINTLDFNIIQSAFDKYYQAAKIQLLFDLDITAQPAKVLAFAPQAFKANTPHVQYDLNFRENSENYYLTIPYRPEQTTAYMNTFKDAATRTTGELQIFFPQTTQKLNYSDLSQFPDFGNGFKKAFTEDLKNVFRNVFNYIDNYPQNAIPDINTSYLKEKNISSIKANDNYYPFKLTVETMEMATVGYDPVSLINYLDNKYYSPAAFFLTTKTVLDKIGISLHGLNLIQSALRDTSNSNKANIWITMEQLNVLNNNEKRYFAGLIYQRDVEYFNKLYNFNSSTPSSLIINKIEQVVTPVLEQLSAIQNFINDNPSKERKENYPLFLSLNCNLLTNNPFLPSEVKPLFTNRTDLLMVYENMHNHNFNSNTYYTLKILNELQQTKQDFNREFRIIENYSAFMNDIVSAHNSDDLEQIIKKYIPKK